MLCYTGHMRLHCRTKWQGVAGFSQIRTPFIPPRAYLCYKCDSRCNQQHRRRHQLCCFFSYFFPSWALPPCFTLSLYIWLSLSLRYFYCVSISLRVLYHSPIGFQMTKNEFAQFVDLMMWLKSLFVARSDLPKRLRLFGRSEIGKMLNEEISGSTKLCCGDIISTYRPTEVNRCSLRI